MTAGVVVAVLVAGAFGATLRWLVSRTLAGRRFPVAVLLVNTVGSAIGGVILALSAAAAIGDDWRLILLTGFCGGLTTFSTLSVETVQLVLDGRARVAVLNVTLNVAIGLVAASVAFALTSALVA